jgi:hypothetical protein
LIESHRDNAHLAVYDKGERTSGVDADECLRDLKTYGVHVTDAHLRITQEALH